MDDKPYELIPEELRRAGEGEAVKVDLNRPMAEGLKQLSQYPVSNSSEPERHYHSRARHSPPKSAISMRRTYALIPQGYPILCDQPRHRHVVMGPYSRTHGPT